MCVFHKCITVNIWVDSDEDYDYDLSLFPPIMTSYLLR